MPALIRRLLLGFVLSLLSTPDGQAATVTAASCASASVQAAVNAAANGDTVVIPNGSCTWTSGVSTNKQITITGQTSGGVVLTHSAGGGDLFSLTTGASFSTRLSNITFLAGSGTGRYLFMNGSGKPPLIHDNYFRVPNSQLLHCLRLNRNGGVIYRNTFESFSANGAGSGCVQVKNESDPTSWSSASTMGTADTTGTANVYIEDNVFNNIFLQAVDCDDNARVVVRRNTFNDSAFVCHGADTSPIGVRHTEVYDNTFTFRASGSSNGVNYPLNLNWWWYVRGGTGVATGNVMPNISSVAWGAKPEINFIVQQLRRRAGPDACCSSYPCMHQIGRSHNGTSLSTEPLYIWGNTGTGSETPALNDYSPNECGGDNRTSQWVQSGRDYVVGVAKPGYTRYPYPHPLRGSTPVGPRPSPPSGVRVQ
jgi:hypothetical protein